MPIHVAEGVQLSSGANICMNGGTIKNVPLPTTSTSIISCQYYDSVITTKDKFLQMPAAHNVVYPVSSTWQGICIANTGTCNLTFRIPVDFNSLICAVILLLPNNTAAGADKCICFDAQWGKAGEPYNNCTTSCYTTWNLGSATCLNELNISSILSGVYACAIVGIKITHALSSGSNVYYYGTRLYYT